MTEVAALPKRPTSSTELAETVRAATAGGAQVRMVGADSMPMTSFDDQRPMQAVSTLRMNKVLEHAVGDMTVIVQAGISLEALQRQLAWHNQWLPIDPPMVARAGAGAGGSGGPGQRTVGGLIATNSLGPLRFGSGDWRLLIMGMKWVDGNGTLIKGGGRTVKNVAGYNTPRMMIGSCGSLGAIAEVTLRTFARPADEQCVIFFCDGAERAEALIAAAMTSPTTPAYVQVIGGGTFATNPLQLPTMKRGMAVVVGFLDRPDSCAAQIDTLRELSAARGMDSISQTAAQAGRLRLWMTTEPRVDGSKGDAGFGMRVSVLSSETAGVIKAIERAAGEGGGSAWVVGEAGTGVVRGVVAGVGDGNRMREVIGAVAPGGRLVVTQGGRGRSGEKADGLLDRMKRALDPKKTFGMPHAE